MKSITAEKWFIALMLASAVLVAGLRLLRIAWLTPDASRQVQAAHLLIAGKGLATYKPSGESITAPLELQVLTEWPCGYSLYAAVVLLLGGSLGLIVKLFGATFTVLGWWGWGRLAIHYLGPQEQWGAYVKCSAYVTAIACPTFFTPWWSGTDISVWAMVPWVLEFLCLAATANRWSSFRLDLVAGGLCGLCLLMRYASLFLPAYGVLLILLQSKNCFAVTARRGMTFAIGIVPATALQYYFSFVLPKSSTNIGGLDIEQVGAHLTFARAFESAQLFSGVNHFFLFWVPDKVLEPFVEPRLWAPVALLIACALPILMAWRHRLRPIAIACRDPRAAACGLLIVLIAILWLSTALGQYNYLGEPRYYWPLLPLPVLVACSLARPLDRRAIMSERAVRVASVCYLAAFMLVCAAKTALCALPQDTVQHLRQAVGMHPNTTTRVALTASQRLAPTLGMRHWFSMQTDYEFLLSRNFVVAYLRDSPNTFLLTNFGSWFFADAKVNQSRVRAIAPCEAWRGTQIVGPASMLLFLDDSGGPWRDVYYQRSARMYRCHCLETVPDLRLLRRFPEEETKVLVADIPDGVRIVLGDRVMP